MTDKLSPERIAEIKAQAEAERRERAESNGHVDAIPPPPEPDEPPDDHADDTRSATDDKPPLWARLDAKLLTRSALHQLPEPEPLIDNVLDQGTTALLYGRWSTYKTFIALDWAASVATGRRWQGRETQCRTSLYVAGEGAYGYRARVDAWEQAWAVELDDDALQVLPVAVNLTRLGDVNELCALITHRGYGLVVIDTLARCMVAPTKTAPKTAVSSSTRWDNCGKPPPTSAASSSAYTTPARTAKPTADRQRSKAPQTPCTSRAATG
jgi:hypothetical protein